jgi:hypothetical protein
MSFVIFLAAELLGVLLLAGFAKGVVGVVPAALAVLNMLVLSFHVLARRDKPDGTSIRMASFASVLGYAAILGGKLTLEMRSGLITTGAGLFTLFCIVLAGFAAWSVIERPLDIDVE